MSYDKDEDDLILLLKDDGVGKLCQYAPLCMFCIERIELRVQGNLRKRCPNFCEKLIRRFGTPFEIPLEGLVDLLLCLRMDANALLLHPARRARSGASTSSQE